MPPHIYAVADRAYEAMCVTRQPQAFVIRCSIYHVTWPGLTMLPSGESGAGKTETTKFIVSHIIELCKAGKTALEEKIKMVNPMLEAFGNAKTGTMVLDKSGPDRLCSDEQQLESFRQVPGAVI